MLPEQPDIDPAVLASTEFSKARRGLEPTEVRAALGRAADALRAWQLRDQHLAEQIEDLRKRLTAAEQLDEAHVASVLGEETARIVTAAREAASEIRSKAEEQAERMIREADEQATAAAAALRSDAQILHDEASAVKKAAVAEAALLREQTAEDTSSLLRETESRVAEMRSEAEAEAATVREDAAALATSTVSAAQDRHDELVGTAESLLADRTAEADAAAAEILEAASHALESAETEASSTVSNAREQAEQLRLDAQAEADERLEAARRRGVEMVEEAKAVRERMLTDLAERRREARRQIEAAIAGRDRIVELLSDAHSHVASTIDGLDRAHADAASAADAAASAVEASFDEELAELTALAADASSDPDAAVTEPDDALDSDLGAPDEQLSADPELPVDDDRDADAIEVSAVVADIEDEAVDTEAVVVADIEAETEATEAESEAVEVDEATVADVVEIADFGDANAFGSDATVASDDDEDYVSEDDGVGGGGSSDEGATVHDLFERIRAASPEASDDGEATDVAEAAAIDLTEARSGPADDASTPLLAPAGSAADSASDAAEEAVSEAAAVAVLDAAVESDHDLLDLRDERLVPVERSLARVLKRIASDEQNEVLDRLRRVKRGRPDPDSVLPEATAEPYIVALEAEYIEAVGAGTRFWGELVGTTVEAPSTLDDASRERLTSRVEEFVETHHAHLTKTFADAEMAGLDAADIGDRLRAAYRDWRSASLAGFAGDLATAGFTSGQLVAAEEGSLWRWVVDNGGLGCADGEDNALAGPVECSSPFPTGDITPPAHPGCRCILAPAR